MVRSVECIAQFLGVKMAKNKKTRKPYNTDMKKQPITKNDKLLGQLKIIFLLSVVVVISVLAISQINS